MSAEKIIERIQKDTKKEITTIQKQAEHQAEQLLKAMKKQSEEEAEKILADATLLRENTYKIHMSRAAQELKREQIQKKEEIIESCFKQALDRLSNLETKRYTEAITHFLQQGIQQLGADCMVLVSKDIDREIAQKFGLKISGSTQAIGGVILISKDSKIKLDYTFPSILQRKKEDMRIKLASMLFTQVGE